MKLKMVWSISLIVCGICGGAAAIFSGSMPDWLKRVCGILLLIALPVFTAATVLRIRQHQKQDS